MRVVVIRGAYAPPDQFSDFGELLPEAAVILGDLPDLADPTLGRYVSYWDGEISRISGPVVVCGSSLGGTVALALSAPNLCGVVALDPPMTSADIDRLKPRLGPSPFGWPDEPRDWFPLLAARSCPATVLFGDGGRPTETPTLLTVENAMRLAILPGVRVVQMQGVGHNMLKGAKHHVVAAIRKRLSDGYKRNEHLAGAADPTAAIRTG